MIHPFFDNTSKTLQYAAIWLLYAIIQTFIFNGLINVPLAVLLTDGLIHGTLFGLLGALLWSVIRYGNFSVLTLHQRLLNYIALAIIALVVWLGLGYYGIELCFGSTIADTFIPLLPTKGFIGLLVYLLLVLQFRLINQNEDTPTAIEPAEQETAAPGVTEEIAIQGDIPVSNSAVEVLERIAVKSGAKIHVIMIPEIIYMQADGDYVQIFTTNGKYLKEQTMKYFETHLPPTQFVRVHRSIIVNVEMISRIELYEKQSQQITLKNGQQIKTSPAGYKSLRAVLNL